MAGTSYRPQTVWHMVCVGMYSCTECEFWRV